MAGFTFEIDADDYRNSRAIGSAGDDSLAILSYGFIHGLGGNDRIGVSAIAGPSDTDNRILGGPGADAIGAGFGQDTVSGGPDDDGISTYLEDRPQDVFGGSGDDTIVARFSPSAGLGQGHVFAGGPGSDLLTVRAESSSARGGFAPEIRLDEGALFARLVTTRERLGELRGFENVRTDLDDAVVAGTDRANVLTALGARADLRGGGGADRLEAANGPDSLDGGRGRDTLIGSGDRDLLRGQGGADLLYDYRPPVAGSAPGIRSDAFDTLLGGAGADTLIGNSGTVTASGGEDDDLFHSLRGTDILIGGAGDDLFGFTQPGLIEEAAAVPGSTSRRAQEFANLVIDGGPGRDWIEFLYVTDSAGLTLDLPARSGHFVAETFAFTVRGIEAILASPADDTIRGAAAAEEIFGADGDDHVRGGGGPDTLYGDAGRDTLVGGALADTLEGNLGDDSLIGNAGPDTLDGGPGEDVLEGGTWIDILRGGPDGDALRGGAGDDYLFGGGGGDTLRGGDNVDSLQGGASGDRLYGGRAGDQLFGEGGVDTLSGGRGADVLSGNAAPDDLYGGGAADTLLAGRGLDELFGGPGDDVLDGGPGVDFLRGDAGDDTLIGGAGMDRFIITPEAGRTYIADFDLSGGWERIDMRSMPGIDHFDLVLVEQSVAPGVTQVLIPLTPEQSILVFGVTEDDLGPTSFWFG